MEHEEFNRQVLPIRDKLFRMAKRLLVSREEAEDATQEILMRLWDRNHLLEKYRNVEAFAMTMTKNFCLDRLKSKQAGHLSLVHSNYGDADRSLSLQIEHRDSIRWMEKIVNELPEQQRMVLQLRDVEAYDYDEIAEVMEMKPTAVRVALSRARKTVREQLTKTHSYGVQAN